MKKLILGTLLLLFLNFNIANSAPFLFIKKPDTANQHHYRLILGPPLMGAENYLELRLVLSYLPPDSTIEVELDGPGGDLTVLYELISALKASKAHLIGNLKDLAMASSANAMLACVMDELNISSNSLLNFHAPASMKGLGLITGSRSKAPAPILKQWMIFMKRNCSHLITDKELYLMVDDPNAMVSKFGYEIASKSTNTKKINLVK